MKKIGITGGVGSGKSRILDFMRDHCNAYVCQADHIAHRLQMPGEQCFNEILDIFGVQILDREGKIDRKLLGQIAFGDKRKLDILNAIVHPAVNKKIKQLIRYHEKQGTELFVLEAALLTAPIYSEMLDEIWYISVPEEIRAQRLKEARGYSDWKIQSIMLSQPTEEEFKNVSKVVIDNQHDFSVTEQQIYDALNMKQENLNEIM